MAGEAWGTRINEMIEALNWFDNEGGIEPRLVRRGQGIKFHEAKMGDETAEGINEWDAIRNLWQKMDCPES